MQLVKSQRFVNAEGQLHSLTGPAVMYDDGGYEYWVDGVRHNQGGPAVKFANGAVEYWVWGELHCEDGPALQSPDGDYAYYLNGLEHRLTGGPSSRKGNTEYWRVNGRLHRLGLPAVIEYDGRGKVIREEYWRHGRRHNVDGPAVVQKVPAGVKTTQHWVDGYLHNPNGPAIERSDGTFSYYLHGLLHNLNGAARRLPSGELEYFVMGYELPGAIGALGHLAMKWFERDEYRRREETWTEQAVQFKNVALGRNLKVELAADPEVLSVTVQEPVRGFLHSSTLPVITRTIDEPPEGRTNHELGRSGGKAFVVEEWRAHGRLHSSDNQPAVRYSNGMTSTWNNGEFISATCSNCEDTCLQVKRGPHA